MRGRNAAHTISVTARPLVGIGRPAKTVVEIAISEPYGKARITLTATQARKIVAQIERAATKAER